MKKYLLVILLAGLVFVSACAEIGFECQTDSDCELGVCEDGTTYAKYSCNQGSCDLINYVRNPCEAATANDNLYFIGDDVQVGSKTWVVKDITNSGEIVLGLGSREFIIYGTNNLAKLEDKEITASNLNIEINPSKTNVVLDIQDIMLGENEYVLDLNEEMVILGKKVKLTDVLTDDLDSINMRVSDSKNSEIVKIHKGETVDVLGLKITNIRPNPRPIAFEKYAIIKVEEGQVAAVSSGY